MTSFFEHTCHKCGLIDEARFVFAGPHVKQVCNGCGFYVKFFDKAKVPDVREIKLKIWAITRQDLELIEQAKKAVDFTPCKGLYEKMMYWRVYLKVRELLKQTA
jgi:hypothetical protein